MSVEFSSQPTNIDRRDFLKLGFMAGAAIALESCAPKSDNLHLDDTPRLKTQNPSHFSPEHKPSNDTNNLSPQPEFDPASLSEWNYAFSDYPDGKLPAKDWNFEQGTKVANYNNEAQAYTSDIKNVRIENGLLVVEALKEQYKDRQFTSARINTLNKFSFEYGHLSVDMMLPRGVGTWPAAWLMPKNERYDPDSLGISSNDKKRWATNGEIDIQESIGSIPNTNIPAVHTYNSFNRPKPYTPVYVNTAYSQFHKYGITKTPQEIIFTLDDQPYASRKKESDDPKEWPFDQPYYLIISLAMGGDWAGSQTQEYPPYGIDESSGPWQLKVRSINYRPL